MVLVGITAVFYEAEETIADLNISRFTKQIQKIGHLAPFEIIIGNMISHTFEKTTINKTYRPLFNKSNT